METVNNFKLVLSRVSQSNLVLKKGLMLTSSNKALKQFQLRFYHTMDRINRKIKETNQPLKYSHKTTTDNTLTFSNDRNRHHAVENENNSKEETVTNAEDVREDTFSTR